MATDEAYEAMARALFERDGDDGHGTGWDLLHEAIRAEYRIDARPALDAVWDLAVAEGRRQVANELAAYADNYPPNVFPPDAQSRDGISGTAMRHAYRNAARIAAGETP